MGCLVLGWGMGVPWVPRLSPALKNTINGTAQEGKKIGLVGRRIGSSHVSLTGCSEGSQSTLESLSSNFR